MKKTVIAIFVLLVSVSSTNAIDGKITASSDYSFYDRWYHTQSSSIPFLTETNEVSHKQYFFLYLNFGGYSVDSNSNANVTYNLTILKPDRSVYNRKENIPAAEFKITDSTLTLLAKANLRISFEPEDTLGEYLIKAKIIDNVSDDTAEVSTTISLVPFTRDRSITNDSLMVEWIQSYYQHFRSELAIDAFLTFSKSQHRDDVASQTFTFYHELFSNNPHLIPELKKEFRLQNDSTKGDILLLLAYLNDDDPLFLEQLRADQRYIFEQTLGLDSLFNISKVDNAYQLDMLWTKFFASGKYRPIRTLVDALELVKYKGSIEKYQQSNQDPALENDAYLEATYRSLIWSLDVNSKTFRLVQDYLSYIYNKEQLPEDVKAELKLILTK